MRVPRTVLRAVTTVLPVSFSALVLVVVAGALPGLVAWALVGSVMVSTTGLLFGIGEGVACRLLFGARCPGELERSVLGPAVARVCRAGLGPPLVELRVARRGDGLLASPFGHRIVLVPAGLLAGVQAGTVSHASAAASICHAAAVTRAGLTSLEPGFGVWCLPWLLMARCTAVAARVPLLRLAWRARLVVVTVAIAQLLDTDHVLMGLGLAVLAVATYLLPAADRAVDGHVVAVGDAGVVSAGLGRDFLVLLDRSGAQVGLERRARLATPASEPTSGARILDLVPTH